MFAYTKKGVPLFVAAAAPTFSPLAFGHGGGLDSNGGHYDRKIGVYHGRSFDVFRKLVDVHSCALNRVSRGCRFGTVS